MSQYLTSAYKKQKSSFRSAKQWATVFGINLNGVQLKESFM